MRPDTKNRSIRNNMKPMKLKPYASIHAAVLAAVSLASSVHGASIVSLLADPTGVDVNSTFINPNFVPGLLYNSSPTVGDIDAQTVFPSSGGNQWARAGSGVGVIVFDFGSNDAAVFSAVAYQLRDGAVDWFTSARLWATNTAPANYVDSPNDTNANANLASDVIGTTPQATINPLFPALRSAPMALSGASRRKQIPSSA
jgi:hypothetical protein